jgi:hypothetical protein
MADGSENDKSANRDSICPSELEDREVALATLLCEDEQLARALLSKIYPPSASSQVAEGLDQ